MKQETSASKWEDVAGPPNDNGKCKQQHQPLQDKIKETF